MNGFVQWYNLKFSDFTYVTTIESLLRTKISITLPQKVCKTLETVHRKYKQYDIEFVDG